MWMVHFKAEYSSIPILSTVLGAGTFQHWACSLTAGISGLTPADFTANTLFSKYFFKLVKIFK